MSHTVNITRTTTTVTTSGLFLNTGYFKTIPGLLKFFQAVLGAAAIGLMAQNMSDCRYYNLISRELFFLLVVTTFMIGTVLILLSCLFSISTATILPKTFYELVYHSFAFVLLLAAGITLLVTVNQYNYNKYRYDELLAAGIITLVNAALYLVSTVFAYRSYKGL
ncbi:hypothetical protein RUM43_005670 [Polyplax serrata]|uniref:MARVEL domain-containing protein n=1 Tax=Polyplax serrata TaxID=468196 RepID=A0AAN8S1N2_POLSC